LWRFEEYALFSGPSERVGWPWAIIKPPLENDEDMKPGMIIFL
jgi:hypothetical protein